MLPNLCALDLARPKARPRSATTGPSAAGRARVIPSPSAVEEAIGISEIATKILMYVADGKPDRACVEAIRWCSANASSWRACHADPSVWKELEVEIFGRAISDALRASADYVEPPRNRPWRNLCHLCHKLASVRKDPLKLRDLPPEFQSDERFLRAAFDLHVQAAAAKAELGHWEETLYGMPAIEWNRYVAQSVRHFLAKYPGVFPPLDDDFFDEVRGWYVETLEKFVQGRYDEKRERDAAAVGSRSSQPMES